MPGVLIVKCSQCKALRSWSQRGQGPPQIFHTFDWFVHEVRFEAGIVLRMTKIYPPCCHLMAPLICLFLFFFYCSWQQRPQYQLSDRQFPYGLILMEKLPLACRNLTTAQISNVDQIVMMESIFLLLVNFTGIIS